MSKKSLKGYLIIWMSLELVIVGGWVLHPDAFFAFNRSPE